MHELIASPAEGRSQVFGHLVLSEDAEMGLASLALRAAADPPQIGGVAAPGPGQWKEAGELAAFWIAPNQWMVEAKGRANDDLEPDLRASFPEAAIVEQTNAFVAYEIRSEAGADLLDRVLQKLVNLDPTQLAPGGAVRTGFEHMSLFVVRRSFSTLGVLVSRSMSISLWDALETILRRLIHAG